MRPVCWIPRGDPEAFPLLRVVFQRLGSWVPEKALLTDKRCTLITVSSVREEGCKTPEVSGTKGFLGAPSRAVLEEIQMANKYKKKCPALPAIIDMQMNVTLRFHPTPLILALKKQQGLERWFSV